MQKDAVNAGFDEDSSEGGSGALAYAEAVSVYLALGVSKLADYNSSLVLWSPSRDQTKATFARHALPMVWDFAEVNLFAEAAGDLTVSHGGIARMPDLSDFFYVWLRRSIRSVFVDLYSTMLAPKTTELVAAAYRHGSREKAEGRWQIV